MSSRALRKFLTYGIAIVIAAASGVVVTQLWSDQGAADVAAPGLVTGDDHGQSRDTPKEQKPEAAGEGATFERSAAGVLHGPAVSYGTTDPETPVIASPGVGAPISRSPDSLRPSKYEEATSDGTLTPPEQAYVIPEVIAEACSGNPDPAYVIYDTLSCDKLRGTVADFNKESRDAPWAEARARELTAYLATLGNFQARYVNCRRTLCVLEIQGPRRQAFREVVASSPNDLGKRLWTESTMFGFSADEHGQPITVFVSTLSRIQQ